MADYFGDLVKKAKEKKGNPPLPPENKMEKAMDHGELPEQKIIAKLQQLKQNQESQATAQPVQAEPAGQPRQTVEATKAATPTPSAQPQAVVSRLQQALGKMVSQPAPKTPAPKGQPRKRLIKTYDETSIYAIEGSDLLQYEVPVPKPTSGEKAIINTIREAATRLISIAPYRIRDPKQKRNVYYQKIMEILRNNPELNIPSGRFEFYANAVVREMVGYGVIDLLIQDDQLEEIMIIGAQKPVYVFHREYEMMTTNIEFFNEEEIQDLVNRIARQVGRRVDLSSPLLDARLPDGSRVNATIPPASVDSSSLTIRKFRKDPYSLVDLIQMKTLNAETAAFLWLCVEGLSTKPANILIAGGTGSGKTTMLNALAALIPERERIVTIEDTAELALPLDHWIRLEARPPGLEGSGELTMDILTKNALRMRPDRIIVGEVRHSEAFTLFTALNTGHDGCFGTIHSNSPEETLIRIMSPPMSVPEPMLAGLDLILIEHRLHDKQKGTIRRVTEIAQLQGVFQKKTATSNIFSWNPITDTLERTPATIDYLEKLSRFTGFKGKQIEFELKRRQQFLESLLAKNVRGIFQLRGETNRFLGNRG